MIQMFRNERSLLKSVMTYTGQLAIAVTISFFCLYAGQAPTFAAGWDTAEEAKTANDTTIEVHLDKVHFISDKERSATENELYSDEGTYGSVGTRYLQPEWDPTAGRNNPIVQDRSTALHDSKLVATVSIQVKSPGTKFRLRGDGDEAGIITADNYTAPKHFLDFESGVITATGDFQNVEVTAVDPLPQICCYIDKTIQWSLMSEKGNITLPGTETFAAETGPHEMFIVWNDPKTPVATPQVDINGAPDIPADMANYPTRKRLRLLLDNPGLAANKVVMAGGQVDEAKTVDLIARTVQAWRDFDAGISNDGSNIIPDRLNGNQLWGLLDGTGAGQCAEGSRLMALMLNQLGIEAKHHHVIPSVNTVLVDTINPLREHDHDPAVETTTGIKSHCSEQLWMWFGDVYDLANYPTTEEINNNFHGWNQGEGCAAVGDKWYPAWASDRDQPPMIGQAHVPKRAISGAHSILIQLDDGEGHKLQRWCIKDTDLLQMPGETNDDFALRKSRPEAYICPGPNAIQPVP